MSAIITEDVGSRRYVENSSAELNYKIFGTADEAEALTLLNSTAPAYFQGIKRKASELEPVFIDTINPVRCLWQAIARYRNDLTAGSSVTHPTEYGFDTSGGSQHITQAESHVHSYAPAGSTAPNHRGAIGVANGNVEGVDIIVPCYTWSEGHFIATSNLTLTYRGLLHTLTGTVNGTAYRGMAAGECLFMGASGNWSDDDDGCMVTFTFSSSPNRTGLTIGDITGIDKKGWEYLWVEYEQAEDSSAKKMVAKPVAVHIEQTYKYTDFADLGI